MRSPRRKAVIGVRRLTFDRDILKIDPEAASSHIARFIREAVKSDFHAKGIVVGLSGGVDSAVAAALSARALGPDRVYTLLLPERGWVGAWKGPRIAQVALEKSLCQLKGQCITILPIRPGGEIRHKLGRVEDIEVEQRNLPQR